jgi:hypothetical protein
LQHENYVPFNAFSSILVHETAETVEKNFFIKNCQPFSEAFTKLFFLESLKIEFKMKISSSQHLFDSLSLFVSNFRSLDGSKRESSIEGRSGNQRENKKEILLAMSTITENYLHIK